MAGAFWMARATASGGNAPIGRTGAGGLGGLEQLAAPLTGLGAAVTALPAATALPWTTLGIVTFGIGALGIGAFGIGAFGIGALVAMVLLGLLATTFA